MKTIKTAEQLIEAEAREAARVDLLAETLTQDAREEIDDLLHNLDGRDSGIFALLGADPETTLDDYEDIDREDRDSSWVLGVASLLAAARLQFLAGRRDEVARVLSERAAVAMASELGLDELKRAAKIGITKGAIEKARDALTFRDVKELTRVSVGAAEFLVTIEARGIIQPFAVEQVRASGTAARMIGFQTGSAQFTTAVADAIETEAAGGVAQTLRHAAEKYSTQAALDERNDNVFSDDFGTQLEVLGDDDAEFIWIAEMDASTCEACSDNNGQIHPYSVWLDSGLPGADVCHGGDRCRCDLFPA